MYLRKQNVKITQRGKCAGGALVHSLHAAKVLVRIIDLGQRSDWQSKAGEGRERGLGRRCAVASTQPSS